MRLNFYEKKPKTKVVVKYKEKKDYTIPIAIGIVVVSGLAILIGFNVYKNSKCNNIENLILKYANEYAQNNNLLNLEESDSVTVDMVDVYSSGYPNVLNSGKVCNGTVKFTMVEGKIIDTLNVTDCLACSTDSRYGSWKETDSLPSKRIVDVKVKYNYYDANVYYSKWTKWLASSLINKETDSRYNIKLPSDSKNLPDIPSTSEILTYEAEYDTYYRYQDKTWKWYKNPNSNYTTSFYSEKPSGYANKDEGTLIYTEWSNWSLDYPDVKEYRVIQNTTGYRWYYLDENENKHYYNGGEYTSSKPDEKYTKYDNTATLYSYRDKMWKWYNGEPREYYSSYSTKAPYNYTYKDSSLSSYTKWSNWSNEKPSSESYRTIETDVYTRYRAMYRDVTYLVLDNYLSLEDFEKSLDMSLSEIRKDNTKKISYKYTYLYR